MDLDRILRWNFLSSVSVSAGTLRWTLIELEIDRTLRWMDLLSSVSVSAGTLRWTLIELEMELSIKCLSFCRNLQMDLDRT